MTEGVELLRARQYLPSSGCQRMCFPGALWISTNQCVSEEDRMWEPLHRTAAQARLWLLPALTKLHPAGPRPHSPSPLLTGCSLPLRGSPQCSLPPTQCFLTLPLTSENPSRRNRGLDIRQVIPSPAEIPPWALTSLK